MADTPNLDGVEGKSGSITGRKILNLANSRDIPKVDDGILSPYREEIMGS